MTTIKLSIRDLVREGKNLTKYDFVDIEDKKTKDYKGIFVSYRHADEVKKFLAEKKRKRKERIMKFAGIMDGVFGDETIKSIKSKMK